MYCHVAEKTCTPRTFTAFRGLRIPAQQWLKTGFKLRRGQVSISDDPGMCGPSWAFVDAKGLQCLPQKGLKACADHWHLSSPIYFWLFGKCPMWKFHGSKCLLKHVFSARTHGFVPLRLSWMFSMSCPWAASSTEGLKSYSPGWISPSGSSLSLTPCSMSGFTKMLHLC